MDDSSPVRKGLRTTLLGILVNLGLAIVKATAGVLGNSYALIADAIESTSDILTSLAVYVGLRVSSKPRDENHPYGHGKAEPITAIFVTLALLGAAVVIVIQSVHEILTPHHAPAMFTLFVLAAVVLIKETLFRFVFKVGDTVHSSAVKADAWHHRSDAITSSAVFIGILIAVIGGKGWESADDWAALLASAMIVFNAIRLFIPALNEIMDARPQGDHIEKVRQIAAAVPGVRNTEKCMVRKMGLDYYVDLHIHVDGDISVREGHAISHRVKDALLNSDLQIVDVSIHIEPFEGMEENDMSLELWTKVDSYIDQTLVPTDKALDQALADSKAAGLPDIQVTRSQGKYLHIMAKLANARRILEVGTLGGYSTIWMARALPAGGKLVTLELEDLHARVALANLKRAGVDKLVELRQGPALDSLAALAADRSAGKIEEFDFVFIDADKQNNSRYLSYALKLTRKGGLIIVDNVIRDGAVINAGTGDAMVIGVREMNAMIAKEPRLNATAVQTVGAKGYDGFAIMIVE